ncbi:MAG: PQQ-binding-like beta-propeller repeat protein, partial [Pseudomonadota bacterium]
EYTRSMAKSYISSFTIALSSKNLFFIFMTLAFAPWIGGCGGARIKTSFPAGNEANLSRVIEKLQGHEPAAAGRPVVAVVKDKGSGLALFDIDTGEKIWEKNDIRLSSAPAIGEGKVVFNSDGDIVALSAATGERLWARAFKQPFVFGFAFDGGRIFVTGGNTDGGSPATGRKGLVMALDASSGSRLWSTSADKMFGAPAAAEGYVFVPWDRQAVSIIDAQEGKETCRFIRKDSMVDFVVSGPGGVYYGSSKDVQKLTKESLAGTKTEAGTFEVDQKIMPGNPRVFPDTYRESHYESGAEARNRILWTLSGKEGAGSIGFAGDMYFFVFYRYVVGFDTGDRLPRWVYMSDAQIATSSPAGDGILVLAADGSMTYVDAETGTSGVLWQKEISTQSAFFGATGFEPPALDKKEPDLHRGLVDMILDVDTQVLPLRKFGMKLLADLPDEMVTMDLVQVMASHELPKALRDEAAKLLRTRKGGSMFLVEALKQHQDFLSGTPPPPSGAIAASLAETGEEAAAFLLIEHLGDHETPADELTEISAAIVKLADKDAYEPLRNFLSMYHADSCMKFHPDVMVNVAAVVMKFGGEDGRKLVETIARDLKTPESLRYQLTELLDTGEEGGVEIPEGEEAGGEEAKGEEAGQEEAEGL